MAKFTDPKTISDTPPHALVNEDCVVWLDASDITTLYQLSSNNIPGYTTPVTLVNEKIGMWLDKSVYGNNFGVINTSNRPSYTLSGVYFDSAGYNYLNCIKDDINGVYSFTTNQLGVSGLTMFMVVEPTVTTGTRVLLTQTWSPTSLGIGSRPELTYASALSSWAPTLLLNSAYQASFKNVNIGSITKDVDLYTDLNLQTRRIITSKINENTGAVGRHVLYTDGAPNNTASTFSALTATTICKIRLGADLNHVVTPNSPYAGYIREVIIYKTALSYTQQKFVEAYLGEKWNAPYHTYAITNGDYDTPTTWFNEVVPQLSTATILPNGNNVTLTTSKVYPRFQSRVLDNVVKGGSFVTSGTLSLTTEYILQDIPFGVLGAGPAVTPMAAAALAAAPVFFAGPGSTSNITANRVVCNTQGASPFYLRGATVQLNIKNFYGFGNCSVLSADNSSVTFETPPVQMGHATRYSNSVIYGYNPIFNINNTSTVTLRNCVFTYITNPYITTGESATLRHNFGCPRFLIGIGSGGVFENCTISGLGSNEDVDNSYVAGVAVNGNAGGSTSTVVTFKDCTLYTSSVNTNTSNDPTGVYLNGPLARGVFSGCTIKGHGFNSGSSPINVYGAGLYIDGAAQCTVSDSIIYGGDGNGVNNTSTNRYDQINTYPAAIRMNTGTLTLTSCEIRGNNANSGQGIHLMGGTSTVNTINCEFYAGVKSNAINGSGTTVNISGPIIEDFYNGYRAIALPKYFINPVPKNAYIRYAANGTGVGFDAYTYQYTVDSLSAFSMPDEGDVRKGIPYAGGLLTGKAIIPPISAVSYGTLVDNSSGTAILTLDLLNTFFQTPLSALSTPGTIGYRVANSLNTVESVGHLIASFTTG
jgi:hypothetical protein